MSAPAIKLCDSAARHAHLQHPHRPQEYGSQSAGPMGIPNVRETAPPPLPPPRYIPDLDEGMDTGWQFANRDRPADLTAKRPGDDSSRRGSNAFRSDGTEPGTLKDCGPERSRKDSTFSRRDTAVQSPAMDVNLSESRRPSVQTDGSAIKPTLSALSEQQLGRRTVEDSSQRYDQQLLSRIGGPSLSSRSSVSSLLSPHSTESTPQHRGSIGQLNGQLKPLSMPERRFSHMDSPSSRRPSLLSAGAISPGNIPFRSPVYDPSPADASTLRRASTFSVSSAYEDPIPLPIREHRASYDRNFQPDPEFAADESGMRELNINDRSPSGSDEYQTNAKPGQKRRASSPPPEPGTGPAGSSVLAHRRSAQRLDRRSSPVPRLQGSVSSAASMGPRTNSYNSSYNLSVASSITSYNSERLSPSAISPMADPEYRSAAPYSGTRSLNPSPRGSISSALSHQRTLSESEPAGTRQVSTEQIQALPPPRNVISRVSGLKVCECCPKKPKRFETEEQLKEHEQEKQYACMYCTKRFKNKNEAERHQNSLHLRRHSWSCAALAGDVAKAYHPASSHPSDVDLCGYCGNEFPSNPPNWQARAEHLNTVHKFGECNQGKKFFRADHFRQHLKHSHAGLSGKWTNMLENECMKDEPLPIPLSQQQQQQSTVLNPIVKERLGSISSLRSGPPGATKPDVINEVHEES